MNRAAKEELTSDKTKELIGLKINFNITSKEVIQNKRHFHYKIVIPHILMIIITIISWIISTRSYIYNNISVGAYILNMAWSIYNFIGI